jgi:undecaprenyl diphosphate synthase
MTKIHIKHIAFIMDGNRRWGVAQGISKMQGHTQGMENFKRIVEYCVKKQNIEYLTFWALSTDNLKKREKAELQHLFKLLGKLQEYLHDFIEYDARVRYIGDLSKLPAGLRAILKDVEKKTEKHTTHTITFAINYGGRDEIVRMAKKIVAQSASPNQVSEKSIAYSMDSGWLPLVDMVIRTGGHSRLSGFLPWIAEYAELYFTDKKWPEFSSRDLQRSLTWYEKQQKNFGK